MLYDITLTAHAVEYLNNLDRYYGLIFPCICKVSILDNISGANIFLNTSVFNWYLIYETVNIWQYHATWLYYDKWQMVVDIHYPNMSWYVLPYRIGYFHYQFCTDIHIVFMTTLTFLLMPICKLHWYYLTYMFWYKYQFWCNWKRMYKIKTLFIISKAVSECITIDIMIMYHYA